MTIFALYNPYSGHNTGKEKASALQAMYETPLTFLDMTAIESYADFVKGLAPDDRIIVCGGDGTLNRFINDTYELDIQNDIFYYATGSGNDFLRDFGLKAGTKPMRINDEIKNLADFITDSVTDLIYKEL